MNESPVALSLRTLLTPPSPIRKLAGLKTEAQKRGIKVFGLNIGQPDVETPKEFLDGVKNFDSKILAYADSEGDLALRKSLTTYMEQSAGVKVPFERILITTGASEALIFAFMTACDPGDEVLIFDPTYANYMGFAAVTGVRLMPIVTKIEDHFKLPESNYIEERISKRTKAILLCNPNNPTGTVYTEDEVKRLLAICNKYNLFLVVDETYRELVFDGIKQVSVLNIEPDNPRVIVIDSLSKRFSLCGARLGFLITANQDFYQKTLNIAQARLSSPTIEQYAANYMLNTIDSNYIESVRAEYQSRRDVLFNELTKIPSLKITKAMGAFYSIVELPVDNAEHFAEFLLKEFSDKNETIFLAPAHGFYMSSEHGKKQVRIAYVLNEKDLKRSVEILKIALNQYCS
ncbi:UNVERIFIED_CONTAM: hypothetical protein GTU68_035797 [Idotea baltica]|nr:hypothetical protein [Idotea baltica]